MNKLLIATFGLLTSTLVMQAAVADTRDPGLNQHQRHQHARVAQGI